jgi:hypothetical protein
MAGCADPILHPALQGGLVAIAIRTLMHLLLW